ncbi:MAG: RidA family protein [Rhodospirillales bacterium]|jgi:enamine deaminase RidA (YjgF/YER057c/UK114 family)|nr:RidA family protein [Rhodospirillales bacterium]
MADGALSILQPQHWPRPAGYANGVAGTGRLVVLAGQVGWDESGHFATGLVAQIEQALCNILTVLAEAGGNPSHLARLTWFVTDIEAYRGAGKELGDAWRRVMGRHFPAMSVIGVAALVEKRALVEIEAIAIIP